MTPDLNDLTVYTAARIHTMDPGRPAADAVAVADGRIVSVGTVESMQPWLRRHAHTIDDRYGERVCAFIVPAAGHAVPDVAELLRHFTEAGVAKQKTPERVEPIAEFPRTASGKIKKNELRAKL